MKKLFLLFIICVYFISFLCGCDASLNNEASNVNEAASDVKDEVEIYEPKKTLKPEDVLTNDEKKAVRYETEYLENDNDDNLLKLCLHLSAMRIDKAQFYQMVLNYYPALFETYSNAQLLDVSHYGFDTFSALYVKAYVAENQGELESIYNEYKEKANNIYSYAKYVCGHVLKLDALDEADCQFLYDEAVGLFEQAKEDNVEKQSRLDTFTCISSICEAMDKEIPDDISTEIDEYVESQES